jgi:ABC-type polysaccharide/polyol phosphate transport system ATPase subunit
MADLLEAGDDHGGRDLMTPALENGARPVAIAAHGLYKHFRLGEHQSLARTGRRLFRRDNPLAAPGLEALAGVDCTAYRGEAIGIVGSNGSGKSTFLQILAGTTLPTSGDMRVYGRVVPLLAVGLGFHPELTGRENVTLFASSLGIPRDTIGARMGAVTAFAELERHMDTPVKRFSSGMMSRLSFAIGVQFPADIYVFDEVLAVVDGEFQERCLREIRRLHQEGRTIVFVSHSLDQVRAVCGRVMWLRQGRVERFGAAQEVLYEYERHFERA